jgi:transcriptional/translational regulatory protein YebC/TACO1
MSNTALAAVLEKAKELYVPKEILDRNIKKGYEKGNYAYMEKIYEVGIYIIYHFYLRDVMMFKLFRVS